MARIVSMLGRALRETGQVRRKPCSSSALRWLSHARRSAHRASQALDRLGLVLSGEHSVKETLSRHRAVSNLGGAKPQLPSSGFVAPSASVIGDVAIGEHSSVWYGAVVRGDVNSVKIGDYTNLQDGAVIHVAKHNVSGKPRATLVGNWSEVRAPGLRSAWRAGADGAWMRPGLLGFAWLARIEAEAAA
jgi:hypothetical protein